MTARLARDEAYLQEEAQRAVERAKSPAERLCRRTELAALAHGHFGPGAGANPPSCGRRRSRRQFIWNRRRRWSARGGGSLSAPRWNTTRRAGRYSLCGAEDRLPLGVCPSQGKRPACRTAGWPLYRKIHKKDLENQNKFKNLLFHNCINYDTITSKLFFAKPPGAEIASVRPERGVSKSLKKLFNEAKIESLAVRDRILLLEDGKEILWMEGFGPSRACPCAKGCGADASGLPYGSRRKQRINVFQTIHEERNGQKHD